MLHAWSSHAYRVERSIHASRPSSDPRDARLAERDPGASGCGGQKIATCLTVVTAGFAVLVVAVAAVAFAIT